MKFRMVLDIYIYIYMYVFFPEKKYIISIIAFMTTCKNPLHEIDWEKISYLDKERNYDRTTIKESLYIRAFDKKVI